MPANEPSPCLQIFIACLLMSLVSPVCLVLLMDWDMSSILSSTDVTGAILDLNVASFSSQCC